MYHRKDCQVVLRTPGAQQPGLTLVDLVDFIHHLASRQTGAPAAYLKVGLVLISVAYLALVHRWRPRLTSGARL